jgi:hypothetical protein
MLKTLAKEEARELVRRMVTARLERLVEAQLDNAEGLKHLMMRDPKTGKFERITGDAKQIDKAVKSKNACWIYTKDPNVQAFTDLVNRAIDKPSEHIQIAGHDGGPIQIQWMTDESDESDPMVIDVTPERGEVDDKVRRTQKVNGHVEASGSTDGESHDASGLAK